MGYKTTTGAVPPIPIPGRSILAYASALTRYLKGARLIFGSAFTVNPGPNGTMVDYLPPGGFDSFKVYRASDGAISIRGGYAQTQTGSLTAVASVTTVSVSADLVVYARYDLGLAGTSTPAWETSGGSIIQTAAALPSYDARYRVVPIAAVTWDGTSSAISGIVQHHTGTLPCPDMIEAGWVQPKNVAFGTTVYGWRPCDGTSGTKDTRAAFISGSSSSPLASGSATATVTITAAALNGAQTSHDHELVQIDANAAQAWASGTQVIVETLEGMTESVAADFSSDVTASVSTIPPNVNMPFYEHL